MTDTSSKSIDPTTLSTPRHGHRPNAVTRTMMSRRTLPTVVSVFVLSLLVPIYFYIGPLRMTPYRVVLLVMMIPLLFAWLSGRAGRKSAPDYLMFLFVIWAVLTLIVAHGLEASLEPGGILLLETIGPYLIARRYIRDEASFRGAVRLLFWIVLLLAPLALIESVSGRPVLLEWPNKIFAGFSPAYMEPRLGLSRAQVTFEHPILYGVFCASTFGLAFLVLGRKGRIVHRMLRAILVFSTTFFSVSTGALVAVVTQLGLILWDHAAARFAGHWRVLGMLLILMYVTVDLLSNRTIRSANSYQLHAPPLAQW